MKSTNIRKIKPNNETKTALELQKYVLWNTGNCPIAEIRRKTASHAKFH